MKKTITELDEQMKKKAAKKSKKSAQNAQPLKTNLTPNKIAVYNQKKAFVDCLRGNGDNISNALESANLSRRTAYDHFKSDDGFAEQWLAAQEQSVDELFAEARNRAVVGETKTIVGKDGSLITFQEKSDTLLIYLLKQGEANKNGAVVLFRRAISLSLRLQRSPQSTTSAAKS